MASLLTAEQIHQVVNNTVVILLARPELMEDWHANLFEVMKRAQAGEYEDESLFLAAVLALILHPTDTLPTGTSYDSAWETLITGLQTGVVREHSEAEKSDTITIDQLLASVTEAVVAVMTQLPEQKPAIIDELRQIRTAAADGDLNDLVLWLDDALALLRGTPLESLGGRHEGLYAQFWTMMAQQLE